MWVTAPTPATPISVLVTGIQSRERLRVERPFRVVDATLLDSCDEHRNEGGWGGCYGGDVEASRQRL
ncbi:MAG: hypothetical protein EOP94_05255 [Zymomonas sp.]|nr:MAG: hypothetical protein EOP94_05255 [Zymomonas sp.]